MKKIRLPFFWLFAFLLAGCTISEIGIHPEGGVTTHPFSSMTAAIPTTINQPMLTDTNFVKEDCFQVFHIGAWQDVDGNGLWGPSEPPLEGVQFDLYGTYAELWGYPYLSKEDGWVTLETWSPGGCPENDFTILAHPPESYEPTTPVSVTIVPSAGKSPFEARFGFRPAAE